MEKIEFINEVKFGDTIIDSIEVHPLTFLDLSKLWTSANSSPGSPEVLLQRNRIAHQAHFMSGDKRLVPDAPQISQLPLPVARSIINKLDEGSGEQGSLVSEGDGITTPVVVRLGTPVRMKDGKGSEVVISELEFLATTYGEVEDVLAADNDLTKSLVLLSKVAAPLGSNLTRLPGWALDRITTSDGLLVMREVLPHF